MQRVNIIICDDHHLFTEGLSALLSAEEGLVVSAQVHSGHELFSVLPELKPDILLLDLNMPKMDGFAVMHSVKTRYPSIKVIILSTYSDGHIISKAYESGANGYIVKSAEKHQFIDAIIKIASGDKVFPLSKPPHTVDEDSFQKINGLTNREVEVLKLLKKGLTNQKIADELFLSIYTVETHRKNIMHKLKLKTPVGLFKFLNENDV